MKSNKKPQIPQKKQRFQIPPRVLQGIGYSIVGIAVILSWFITNIPVAAGFTILAVVRVGITLRETRRQALNAQSSEPCSFRG